MPCPCIVEPLVKAVVSSRGVVLMFLFALPLEGSAACFSGQHVDFRMHLVCITFCLLRLFHWFFSPSCCKMAAWNWVAGGFMFYL